MHVLQMDIPGSETALGEVMCRVFGHLAVVAKFTDDLY